MIQVHRVFRNRNTMLTIVMLAWASLCLLSACEYAPTDDGSPMDCVGRESGAVIDGKSVPKSAFQADCAYPPALNGESIKLTTWGILIQYQKGSNKIVSAWIIKPDGTVTAPENSILFAGYRSYGAANRAYQRSNPTSPTPMP